MLCGIMVAFLSLSILESQWPVLEMVQWSATQLLTADKNETTEQQKEEWRLLGPESEIRHFRGRLSMCIIIAWKKGF